jgi:lysophospholipase L1-like esterase
MVAVPVRAAALALAGLLVLAATGTTESEQCPAVNGTARSAQRTTCPAGWRCALKDSGPTGACHFEYPPDVRPHRENCYGCAIGSDKWTCEPNLPTVPMSDELPNVLIVGDSISHGYFPVLRARLNGSVAALQHAPSNTGALPSGVACWNISTTLGANGDLPKPWDLVVFNFGLHDTSEPTPPPLPEARPEANYMALLTRYTELVLHSGRAKRGLWASTTPFMAAGVWRTVETMNKNASELMNSVGVPVVDLFGPIVRHCAPSGVLPYDYCDICSGSTPGHPVAANSTPHYPDAGYGLLVDALVPAIKAALSHPARGGGAKP